MSHRLSTNKFKTYALKQRKSVLSAVTSDRWFDDQLSALAVAFRGGTFKFYDYIASNSPTLSPNIISRIDQSARYAARLTNNNPKAIIDLVLANTNTIWDFRDFNQSFQDVSGGTPVTANGQAVGLSKPFTGTNNFALNSETTPGIINQTTGVKHLNSPISEYRCNLVNAKTIINVLDTQPYVGNLNIIQYPFILSVWNDINLYRFHPALSPYDANPNRYFSESFALEIYASNIWLNRQPILATALDRVYGLHIISITSSADILPFNSISADSHQTDSNLQRHYSGDYRFIFASINSYTNDQMRQLNMFVSHYAGLV